MIAKYIISDAFIVMTTAQGLFLWTRSAMTKDDAPHEFRPIKDDELWRYGL